MTSVQNETSLHIARDDGHGIHGMMGIFAKVCRVDVDVETLKGLSDIGKIVAIKEEIGDIRRVTDMFNSFGDRFDIFCGVDDLLLESVALGAVGWVSGMTNAWPVECVKLFNLAKGGKFAEALRLYRILTPAFHLDTDVKLVQYIKLAKHLTYGASLAVRAPRLPVEGAELAHAEAVIRKTIADLAAFG